MTHGDGISPVWKVCGLIISVIGSAYNLIDDVFRLNGQPMVSDEWFDMVEKPHADFQEPQEDPDTGKLNEGYSFQFWLPDNYEQEFMASGAFGQYLWIDRKLKYVVAQFSTGQPITRTGESGAGPREKATVMRALGHAAIAAAK